MIVYCSLTASGADPSVDRIERIAALRVDREPQAGDPERDPGEDDRFERSGPAVDEAWPELEEFVGGASIVVRELSELEAWRRHFGVRGADAAIGLGELEALFGPAGDPEPDPSPDAIRARARAIVDRFLNQEPSAVDLLISGYRKASSALASGSPRGARTLRTALEIVEVLGGRDADTRIPTPANVVDDVVPACRRELERWERWPTLAVESPRPSPFLDEDRSRLDEVFEEHLPRSFAGDSDRRPREGYRRGQHEVARAVADVLGSGELLLVHAPTGTGKTLAYLVPALLWSARQETRVGIATFTRALQQQAMDRELPRALAALASTGLAPLPRVSMLKGRENYLCWRAWKLAMPLDDEDGEAWLAWTRIAAAALCDADADLDRIPKRPPIPLESSAPWNRAFGDLLRAVRSRSACCVHEDDRRTCGAEVARQKAERSHVVITNQAFALARREFFKHLVFDECEHLHEQAHSAWSHVITFRQMRASLARAHAPGRAQAPDRMQAPDRTPAPGSAHVPARTSSTAVLDRLERAVLEGTPMHRAVATSLAAWEEVSGALASLEASLAGFEAWREEVVRMRSDRESHSLLREYVEAGADEGLVESRRELCRALDALETGLAEVSERLDTTPMRGLPALRRSMDLARTEIAEMVEAVGAWLPLSEGKPAFRPSAFYDVESDARGERALSARVLLPNEVLGREFHPELATGVFVSATTWLRGGFESALGYLGLDRAAEPAEDEDRLPRTVRTFRAPDVFDYSRVLVAVPRDAPSVRAGKDAYLDYVRSFVGRLGERTRGRMLVLFTNAADLRRVGEELEGHFRARSIGLLWQNMEAASKEELADLFRAREDSVLLGVDTFWFGADFPGRTLEYVVIVRLPYGVPDRYHHAQCAALGTSEQWRRIYLPRALAKFRQGFGRLMRKESDRGCVFVLDGRALEPKHRAFLRELPIGAADEDEVSDDGRGARLVRGDTERCLREAMAHMDLALASPDE